MAAFHKFDLGEFDVMIGAEDNFNSSLIVRFPQDRGVIGPAQMQERELKVVELIQRVLGFNGYNTEGHRSEWEIPENTVTYEIKVTDKEDAIVPGKHFLQKQHLLGIPALTSEIRRLGSFDVAVDNLIKLAKVPPDITMKLPESLIVFPFESAPLNTKEIGDAIYGAFNKWNHEHGDIIDIEIMSKASEKLARFIEEKFPDGDLSKLPARGDDSLPFLLKEQLGDSMIPKIIHDQIDLMMVLGNAAGRVRQLLDGNQHAHDRGM